MSKRRTREQKMRAQSKLQTVYTYHPIKDEPVPSNQRVKSYFKKDEEAQPVENIIRNIPVKTGESLNLRLIKKDLIKSLSVASFILCLEVVLYLLWYKK